MWAHTDPIEAWADFIYREATWVLDLQGAS